MLSTVTASHETTFRLASSRSTVYYQGLKRRLGPPISHGCQPCACWRLQHGGISFTAAELASITGGVLERSGAEGSISTDTRSLQPGQWFLAIKGDRLDGNELTADAAAKGCAGVIVSSSTQPDAQHGIILVPDTLQALHRLAQHVRQQFKGPVVAITGSCGKTTTRTMIALVLSARGPVHQTAGNLNNHIGLPLTLLQLPPDASACVLELGMSAPGEILRLAHICQPSVRVVTNVAEAHLAGVGGTLHDVARAKAELVQMARPGDVLVLNFDDPHVRSMAPPQAHVIWFGRSETCHVRLVSCRPCGVAGLHTAVVLRLRASEGASSTTVAFTVPAPGLHLGISAAAAAAVGLALAVPSAFLADALGRYQPEGMRMRVEHAAAGITILNDAYNANPLSMHSALQLLSEVPACGRRVAVLGDMKELGPRKSQAHAEVIRRLGTLDLVALAGSAFQAAVRLAHDTKTFPSIIELLLADTSAELAQQVPARLLPGDVVLIKGSRSMRMELVVQAVLKAWPAQSRQGHDV